MSSSIVSICCVVYCVLFFHYFFCILFFVWLLDMNAFLVWFNMLFLLLLLLFFASFFVIRYRGACVWLKNDAFLVAGVSICQHLRVPYFTFFPTFCQLFQFELFPNTFTNTNKHLCFSFASTILFSLIDYNTDSIEYDCTSKHFTIYLFRFFSYCVLLYLFFFCFVVCLLFFLLLSLLTVTFYL